MKDRLRSLMVGVIAAALVGTAVPVCAESIKPGTRVTPRAEPRPGPRPGGGQMQVKKMDLAVLSVVIELVSTTKGQPGVEFPADKIKISAVVKDMGPAMVSANFTVKLIRYTTNADHLVSYVVAKPTVAGQVWTLVHEDTYVHGPKPVYKFLVEAPFAETSTENNSRELKLNDEVLHAQGRQESSDTAALPGGVQVPGSVIILF
jgi:hypothetical protein